MNHQPKSSGKLQDFQDLLYPSAGCVEVEMSVIDLESVIWKVRCYKRLRSLGQ